MAIPRTVETLIGRYYRVLFDSLADAASVDYEVETYTPSRAIRPSGMSSSGCSDVTGGVGEVGGAFRVCRVVRLDRYFVQRDVHRGAERGDGREQP